MTDAPAWRLIVGDARERLADLEAGSVHTVVTSPPYFGLRDYGTGEWEGGDPACDHRRQSEASRASSGLGGKNGSPPRAAAAVTQGGTYAWGAECGRCGARRVDRQIGLEPTPDEFVAALVKVFREVRRVLRDDGTVWLNLGDSYGAANNRNDGTRQVGEAADTDRDDALRFNQGTYRRFEGVKPKDLLGIPWMVAFALRADGWYLRSDVVWSKPNPMPESVTDRPTKAHEYVFLLSKGPRYFYDADAIREDAEPSGWAKQRAAGVDTWAYNGTEERIAATGQRVESSTFGPGGRNKRSVWTVATQPYAGAHFATFPPKLIEPCILAGAPERACGECGAPWVRKIERVDTGRRQKMADGWDVDAGGHGSFHRNGRAKGESGVPVMENRTLGFEPSCSHGDGSARGVVLDPFAGAGTTLMESLRLGRSAVGIELNPEYAAMARERIELAVRLGFRPAERGPEVPAEQSALFDV